MHAATMRRRSFYVVSWPMTEYGCNNAQLRSRNMGCTRRTFSEEGEDCLILSRKSVGLSYSGLTRCDLYRMNFVYLGNIINSTNSLSLEIQRRINLANRCYFAIGWQLRSRTLSRRIKLLLYKSLIIHVLLYGVTSQRIEATGEFLCSRPDPRL